MAESEHAVLARANAAAEAAGEAHAKAEAAEAARLVADEAAAQHAQRATEAHHARIAAEHAATDASEARIAAERSAAEAHHRAALAADARESAEQRATEAATAAAAAHEEAAARVTAVNEEAVAHVTAAHEEAAARVRAAHEEASARIGAAHEEANARTVAAHEDALALVTDTHEARLQAESAAAEAARARAEAEDRLTQHVIDRQAVESSIRHHTELVEQAYQDRLAAERRAAELAGQLADLRAAVLTAIREKGSKKALASLEAQLTAAAGAATPSTPRTAPDRAPSEPKASEPKAPEPKAPEPKGDAIDLQAAGFAPMPTLDEVPSAKSAWTAAVHLARTGQLPRLTPAVLAELDDRRGRHASHPNADATHDTTDDATDDPTAREATAARERSAGDGVRVFTAESRLGLLTAGEVTVTDDGVMEVRKGPKTYHFDLYDQATKVRLTGRPGQRRWRVEFSSPTESTVVIDAKMVDAEAFHREVLRWRPDAG